MPIVLILQLTVFVLNIYLEIPVTQKVAEVSLCCLAQVQKNIFEAGHFSALKALSTLVLLSPSLFLQFLNRATAYAFSAIRAIRRKQAGKRKSFLGIACPSNWNSETNHS